MKEFSANYAYLIAVKENTIPPEKTKKEDKSCDKVLGNSTNDTSNNSRSKLYQRNLNSSQGQQKTNENMSDNNNETTDEILNKNSRNISQQLNVVKQSSSKHVEKGALVQQSTINNNFSYQNESNISDIEKDNVYKRPARGHKRDLSQDVNDGKRVKLNKTADNVTETSNNIAETGALMKNIVDTQVKFPNKISYKEYTIESHKNLENLNSASSLTKNINKNASPIKDKLEISTITENPRPFIYDESIKDHASEEKEINFDRLMHINNRFIEILRTQTEDNVSLKTNIPVSTAGKISNEIICELKSESEKEMFDLMKKNKDLHDRNSELTKENAVLKENLFKTSVTNKEEKSFVDMGNTIKELQKYILKLEKENVVLKNEFINNIKNKNGMIKKFNEDLNDYQKITTNFMEKFTQMVKEGEE